MPPATDDQQPLNVSSDPMEAAPTAQQIPVTGATPSQSSAPGEQQPEPPMPEMPAPPQPIVTSAEPVQGPSATVMPTNNEPADSIPPVAVSQPEPEQPKAKLFGFLPNPFAKKK